MMLIIFLGLFAKLVFVSGACDLGSSDVKNFNLAKVGISLLKGLLKKKAFKTAGLFYILLVIPLKNSR
jgi:hypothetical protein